MNQQNFVHRLCSAGESTCPDSAEASTDSPRGQGCALAFEVSWGFRQEGRRHHISFLLPDLIKSKIIMKKIWSILHSSQYQYYVEFYETAQFPYQTRSVLISPGFCPFRKVFPTSTREATSVSSWRNGGRCFISAVGYTVAYANI